MYTFSNYFISSLYLQTPSSEEEWIAVAHTFDKWNFPNCIGAVDGKHVVMIAPPNSGSIYYNYKHTHSIVLMAICDGDYKFIYIDAGTNGRIADGGIFNNCSFTTAMNNGALNFPDPQPLPGRDMDVPFVIVADDAFAIKPQILKPFDGKALSASQRIFNYRLSRARRCIENAFGVASARFRVLRSPIALDTSKTRKITLATCVLHNFSLTKNKQMYAPSNYTDHYTSEGRLIEGLWRQDILFNNFYPLERAANRHVSDSANEVRNEFTEYFMSIDGEVPWQYKEI